jgi:hypothetical protein
MTGFVEGGRKAKKNAKGAEVARRSLKSTGNRTGTWAM